MTVWYTGLGTSLVGLKSFKIHVIFGVRFERRKIDLKKQTYKKNETCKLYSRESFEYLRQMSSKSTYRATAFQSWCIFETHCRTYGSTVWSGFEPWRMYCVHWNTRNARLARKSRALSSPATGRSWKPVRPGKHKHYPMYFFLDLHVYCQVAFYIMGWVRNSGTSQKDRGSLYSLWRCFQKAYVTTQSQLSTTWSYIRSQRQKLYYENAVLWCSFFTDNSISYLLWNSVLCYFIKT